MIFGQTGDWQETLIAYAKNYTKRVKSDYKSFVNDFQKGTFQISVVGIPKANINNRKTNQLIFCL
jgi:hypothetical protein